MHSIPIKVLLVEDNPGDIRLIQVMLSQLRDPPFELACVDRLSDGLEHLSREDVDVVLLDLSLPDSQGFTTFTQVRAQAPRVSVIVLTALDDEVLGVQAVRSGAQDYLVKGQVDSNLLARAIRYAMERKRSEEELRTTRDELRSLAGYLQTAREEERAHIAREIHDEFGQALTVLKMDLSWLTKRLPEGVAALREKADTMGALIDTTVQTVRRIATELRPGLLDDLGLGAAIEWQAQEFSEHADIECDLHLDSEDLALDQDLATAIFRIFQETLTNVARHAEATRVRVELAEQDGELTFIVHDNGRGISKSQVSGIGSLGLIGMRERVRPWNGQVAFDGAPNRGTTVTVRIPTANAEGVDDDPSTRR